MDKTKERVSALKRKRGWGKESNLLDLFHSLGLAPAPGRVFAFVKPGMVAVFGEQEPVRVDVVLGDMQQLGDRLHNEGQMFASRNLPPESRRLLTVNELLSQFLDLQRWEVRSMIESSDKDLNG